MSPRGKVVLVLLSLPVVVVLALLLLRPDPEAQVQTTFTTVQEALAEHDAGGVMDQVDADYDILAHWPELGALAGGKGASSAEGRAELRQRVATAMAQYLFIERQRDNQPRLTWTVQEVEDLGDGTVRAVVALGLTGSLRRLAAHWDPPRTITFTLRRHGWLRPHLRILRHDPLHGALNIGLVPE